MRSKSLAKSVRVGGRWNPYSMASTTAPLFKSLFSLSRDSHYPAGFESPALARTSSFLWHWQLDSSRYSRRVTDFSFPREFSYRRLWDERYPTAPSLSSSTRLAVSKYRPRKEGSLRRAPNLYLSESGALFQISFSLIHAQGKVSNEIELSMKTRVESVISRYRYLVFWQIVSQTRHTVRDNVSRYNFSKQLFVTSCDITLLCIKPRDLLLLSREKKKHLYFRVILNKDLKI